MSRYQLTSDGWRYFVREGRVFCPNRTVDVDVAVCTECPYRTSEPGAAAVACRPPAGESLSEMLEAVTRY